MHSKALILNKYFWEAFNIRPVCGIIDLDPLLDDQIDLSAKERIKFDQAIYSLKSIIPDAPLSRTSAGELLNKDITRCLYICIQKEMDWSECKKTQRQAKALLRFQEAEFSN